MNTIYICVYKSFSTMFDKGLRKNIFKKRRDEEIRKQAQWNGSTLFLINLFWLQKRKKA